ncbi:3-keto-disaccharide hydrolase [Caulobacter sp.]|uniref:3-keto-disaccharide hydrolase n=1 Tax=Caulobacter sp. TaxID=78 RepID=UPI003BAEC282
MIGSTTRARRAAMGLALALCAGAASAENVKAGPWRSLFDGKTLNGWTAKVAKHPAGENYRQTFIADQGVIRVSYAGYDKLDGQFGHLFYKTPFKAYRLMLTYRFLTDGGLADTPSWARSNSGIMFLSQSPESMTVDQPFPVSVEFQLLGKDGDAPRPTGAVCTPGLTITIDGAKVKEHCTTPAKAPTIPNGTWVQVELEVLPSGEITQKINGVAVHHYAAVTLDPDDTVAGGAKPYILARGAQPVTDGYIALQSEGHPIEFKDVQIQELTAR